MFIEDKNYPLHITMAEGDFGINLPIHLNIKGGDPITSEDCFNIKIFNTLNTAPVISKKYENIEDNTIEFNLTEEETLLLPKGEYSYDLNWYQNGQFMCNLVTKESFSVIEKGEKVGGS